MGFEQAASPGVAPTQHISAELFFARALPIPRVSLWEQIRLGSVPRVVSSTVLTLPGDLTRTVATLPLSELAQSGEFLTGVAVHVAGSSKTPTKIVAIASYGASAPFANPNNQSLLQNRFRREYWGGLRIASTSGTPHVLEVELGQNEAITGGTFRGAVIRVESLYGLRIPILHTAYLTGSAQLATSRHNRGADLIRLGVALDFLQILKALGIK